MIFRMGLRGKCVISGEIHVLMTMLKIARKNKTLARADEKNGKSTIWKWNRQNTTIPASIIVTLLIRKMKKVRHRFSPKESFFCGLCILFFMLHRLISQPTDSNDLKFLPSLKSLPQTIDMNIYSHIRCFAVQTPDFIHKLQPGKNLIWIGKQFI